jgi:hypothetical protein
VESATQTPEAVRRKSSANRSAEARKSHGRSRLSNGTKLLPDSDGRLKINRRFRDIASAILSDQSGEDRCSESRKQLIRRFAAAACLAEQMEAKLGKGEEIDITQHALLVSTMVRVAQRIGIDRVPKLVTPTISEYLTMRGAGAQASHNGTVRNGTALDLKIDQHDEAIDADHSPASRRGSRK